jgi:hypothetical protein
MAVPSITCTLTRVNLGLADLNINDHLNFGIGAPILGATTSWRRQTVQSPYVESQWTVSAVRDLVQDQFAVNVFGADQVALQNNIKTLVAAISQSYYNLSLSLDAAVTTYACQASDYTIDWSKERLFARNVLVKIMLRRSPVAINGV